MSLFPFLHKMHRASVRSGGRHRIRRRPRLTLTIKDADGTSDPFSCVPVRGRIRLKAVVAGNPPGRFHWITTSRKVRLRNTRTHTVSVRAGRRVSTRYEEIKVRFNPDDGPRTRWVIHRIKIISLRISKSDGNVYGFDNQDNAAGTLSQLSVRKSYRTLVRIEVLGGANSDHLHIASENTSIAQIGSHPPNRGVFNLRIDGGSRNKAATSIVFRVERNTGPVVGRFQARVYKRKSARVKVAKVYDSRSSGTNLRFTSFTAAGSKNEINGWFRPPVGYLNLVDHRSSGTALDVRYDLNNNGALDLEPGTTSAEEQAIIDAITGSGQKAIIIRKLNWIFRLGTAASRGDTSISLASNCTSSMRFIVNGNTYPLGTGSGAENITIQSKSGTTVRLASALTKDHPTTHGIMWPLGGLSGNPIWIQEGSSSLLVLKQVIGHECGHSVFNYRDLNHLPCLMHFSNARTGSEIRYKPIPKKYVSGNENQWESVSRA